MLMTNKKNVDKKNNLSKVLLNLPQKMKTKSWMKQTSY